MEGEELDVLVRPVRLLWRSLTPWNVALAWWLGELEGDPTCNPAEVASIDWFTPAELAALPQLLDSNHHFLAAIERGEIALEIVAFGRVADGPDSEQRCICGGSLRHWSIMAITSMTYNRER